MPDSDIIGSLRPKLHRSSISTNFSIFYSAIDSPKLNNITVFPLSANNVELETLVIVVGLLNNSGCFRIVNSLAINSYLSVKEPLQKIPFPFTKTAKRKFNSCSEVSSSRFIATQLDDCRILPNFYLNSVWDLQ